MSATDSDTPKATLVSSLGSLVSSPSQRVRFAVVGLGRAGHFHMASMKALSDVAELKCVVDKDAALVKRVAEREGCRGSTRLQEALDDRDVAHCGSGLNWHHTILGPQVQVGAVCGGRLNDDPIALRGRHVQ